jgi:pimeloyl-ACP methyl ester carboxylesterase
LQAAPEGPAVILVGGAMNHREFKTMVALAELLSERCTVVNYDRRGRGDSTEAGPFAVEREIEDIAELIEAVGGRASLWGWSSGGALALRAAGADIGVERVSVYVAPFMVDHERKLPSADYAERLDQLVAAGDRSGAVKHFMRKRDGAPGTVCRANAADADVEGTEGHGTHPALRLGHARRA